MQKNKVCKRIVKESSYLHDVHKFGMDLTMYINCSNSTRTRTKSREKMEMEKLQDRNKSSMEQV